MIPLSINIILLFIWILLIKTGIKNKRTQDKILILICGIQLFFFHALKDWLSLFDLPSYKIFFENISYYGTNSTDFGDFEIGYAFFNYIVSRFTNNLIIFSFIISGIIIWIYCKTIYTYSKIIWLSIILYACISYLQSIFVIRQHLAISITLLSIPFIVKREFKYFFLINLIATSIHYSAFIFFLAYFIYKININKNFILIYILVIALSIVLTRVLVFFIISRAGLYSGYIDNSQYESTNFIPGLLGLIIIFISIIFIKIENIKKYNKLFFLLSAFSSVLLLSGIGLPLIPRFALYYNIYLILWIPNMLSLLKVNNKLFLIPIFLGIYIYLYYKMVNGPSFEHYKLIF